MDISKLTLREKIGQTMCLMCEREAHIKRFGTIENMLRQYPIGALYTGKGMENGMILGVNAEEYSRLAGEYNKYSKIPMLKMGDCELSNDKTVSFISDMGLGATDDPQLAYKRGEILGKSLRANGVDMTLSPVVDLNMSPDSPVINTRAYGDDPDRVIPMVRAYVKGIQEQHVAACAKHFPGPDDKEAVDPHLAPADNLISKGKWDATHGKVYRAMIEEGVYTIMSGHQNLVAYQKEKIDGRYPSATVSYDLLTELLKKQLGFTGMIVTDALCMGGFVGAGGLENQVRSLTAGNDMLLWPSFEYLDEVERRVVAGEIPIERIDDAAVRVLELKEKLGLLSTEKYHIIYDLEEAKQLNREMSERSITLIRNGQNVIPAKNIKKVLVVIVTPSDKSYDRLKSLKTYFADCGVEADILRDTTQEEIYDLQKKYDFVMFALCRTVHDPIGPLEFWGNNASSVWASNSADLSKTVVVSFGDPYSFRYYKCTQMTYVNAYSPNEEVQRAVVNGILGNIGFKGRSPVKL